jgi:hypothetical protein
MSDINLPAGGFLRLRDIIGDRRSGERGLLPMSSSTWWAGCKSGRYPRPIKLGPKMTAWRNEDIKALLNQIRGAA